MSKSPWLILMVLGAGFALTIPRLLEFLTQYAMLVGLLAAIKYLLERQSRNGS